MTKKIIKRVDETYKWKKPSIVDRNPELIAFLKTNPRYEEALCYRKAMLLRLERMIEISKNNSEVPRPELDLEALISAPHLTLVK